MTTHARNQDHEWISRAAVLLLLVPCGCDALSPPRRDPSKAPPPPQSSAAEAPRAALADSAPPLDETGASEESSIGTSNNPISPRTLPSATRSDTATPPSTVDARSSDAPLQQEMSVRLSAGVALPQSLPTGTAMGFSVDYEFESGGPQPSYRYIWEIRAMHADQPFSAPVPLQTRGTLHIFVQQWQPRHGPFEAVLVEVRPDGSRRPIARAVQLKASDW